MRFDDAMLKSSSNTHEIIAAAAAAAAAIAVTGLVVVIVDRPDRDLNISSWNLQCHREAVVVKTLIESNESAVNSRLNQIVSKLSESD